MSYGLFLITVLDFNDAMYIYKPVLPGTLFNWFGLGLSVRYNYCFSIFGKK